MPYGVTNSLIIALLITYTIKWATFWKTVQWSFFSICWPGFWYFIYETILLKNRIYSKSILSFFEISAHYENINMSHLESCIQSKTTKLIMYWNPLALSLTLHLGSKSTKQWKINTNNMTKWHIYIYSILSDLKSKNLSKYLCKKSSSLRLCL